MHSHSHHGPFGNGHLVNQATLAAVSVALFLVATKTFAWWVSGSLTIQASLLDSFSDLFSSMINFFAVRYARKPANDEYRFGHGKAEALAGFLQSILIILSTFWIVWHAYKHHQMLEAITNHKLALWVMTISTVLTIGLVAFQLYTIKRTNSIAVKADLLHYQADVLSNVAAVVALIAMSWYGVGWVDTLFGVGIAVFLLYGSWGILKQSFNILMDKELDIEVRLDILKTIQAHPKVIEAHDLRTRSTGQQDFMQMHITLPSELSLQEAHIIGDEVELTLQTKYPHSQILIHLDPNGYQPHSKES
jgi:ferrous-iron efflux pump FieF